MQLEECQCWGVDAGNVQKPWECTTALGMHNSPGNAQQAWECTTALEMHNSPGNAQQIWFGPHKTSL